MLKVRFLGQFSVQLDDQPIEIPSRPAQSLLAYLILNAGTAQRREKVAGLLWPESTEANARSNLRHALWRLRKALGTDPRTGQDYLRADDITIAFGATAAYWLDAAVLDRKTGESAAADDLIKTVSVYEGELLPGFYDEWVTLEQERLQSVFERKMQLLLERLVEEGRWPEVLEWGERWIALGHTPEPAYRGLMTAHGALGDQSSVGAVFQRCVEALRQELGVESSQQTRDLYERLSRGEVTPPVPAPDERPTLPPRPRHNLPVQPTPFVGREAVLTEIGERLQDPDCRLLTLVGPGGCGKTRLALETGAGLLDDFEDGVFFVPLAGLRSVESIEPTVAAALGVSFSGPAEPRRQLLAYLREKSLLLILDNFEHLLPPIGGDRGGEELVTDVLKTAPHVEMLITSRARLKVQGEQPFPVAGMSYPEVTASESADAGQYSALKLFTASARRADPSFELTDRNLVDVTRVCHLVGGMPLGIVLAAAWTEILSPAEIAGEIERSLEFLEAGERDVPERQRSMRAVFDHSWALLTEREREVFAGSSVFRGGFTRQAVQYVTGASLHELMGLVDKSLLARTAAPSTPLRTGGWYEVHELLRQYAEEKLDQEPDAREATRDRHCAYYTAALEQWGIDLKGPRQQAALTEMDVEIDNARGAWDWAAERVQVERLDRAIDGLGLFYDWRGRYEESEAACGAAAGKLAGVASGDGPVLSKTEGPVLSEVEGPVLSRAGGVRVLARILTWQGVSSHRMGHKEASIQQARQSLALLEGPELAGHDTRLERADVLRLMTQQARGSDFEQARRLGEQSVALYEELGDRWGMARALWQLGGRCMDLGAFGEAKRLLERSLELSQAVGDHRQVAQSTIHAGVIALMQGQLDEAESSIRKGIVMSREISDPWCIGWGLCWLGQALSKSGRFTQAQSPQETAAGMLEDLGDIRWSALSRHFCTFTKINLGHWDRASASAQRALALSREADFAQGIALSLLSLSCLALAALPLGQDATVSPCLSEASKGQTAATEAQRLAQESAAILRDLRDRHMLAVTLAVLGAAERRLGNLDQARQQLCEALRTSAEMGAFVPVMYALPAAALLLADFEEHERAVEVYALASRYPFVANSRWFELVYGRHIEVVAATLPPEVAEAAREWGRARDLYATAKELAAEFGA